MKKNPFYLKSIPEAVDKIVSLFPEDLNLATPLGLGKPNTLLNALYDHFVKSPHKNLKIFTALSLEPPAFKEELAQKLFNPIHERIWGQDFPVLRYFQDAKNDKVPTNVQVHEFYFQAGSALRSRHLQRHYQSVNYTHAAENVLRAGVQVIVQLVAFEEGPLGRRYSFSCNPDMTLDVVDLYRRQNKDVQIFGVLHADLPFMEGDAEVDESFFTGLIETQESLGKLFALPRMPITFEDHLIGLYGSGYVEDGGTLQIGIGSLSDALVNALLIRHQKNDVYQMVTSKLSTQGPFRNRFDLGLYGLTEMLTDGFMHLRQAGLLSREVLDQVSGVSTYLHGSFFLGSQEFYQWLLKLSPKERQGLRMTRVSKVNDLYDANEVLLRQQRVKARFFNTTMQVSLLGEAMSETLDSGQVVSGVGGQYNFVAMSHELKDARSVIMLRSARTDSKGKRVSNITWESDRVTIARHLRDIVITEYGVADIRGQSDEQCIQRILNITDSSFQPGLLERAKSEGKLAPDYQIPITYQSNYPSKIEGLLNHNIKRTYFSAFALGSDFSVEEQRLLLALEELKKDKAKGLTALAKKFLTGRTAESAFERELARMGLQNPQSLKEKIYSRLLKIYLSQKP